MDIKEEKVCERFKEIRNSLKMKQADFAKEIKLTQGHVSDIENKRKGVSDRVIEIICLKYGVNETWLRTGEGEMLEELTEQQKILKYTALLLKDKDSAMANAIQTLIVTYEQLDDTSKATLEKIALQYLNNLKKSQ